MHIISFKPIIVYLSLKGDINIDIENEACILDRPITREDVLTALRKLKNKKSAGPDDRRNV